MKLFLDSANVDDITWAMASEFIQGVTTNPSLIAKEATGDYRDVLLKRLELLRGSSAAHFSFEVITLDPDKMHEQAIELFEHLRNVRPFIGSNTPFTDVCVKIPIGSIYMPVIGKLTRAHRDVNVTACFSADQALLAEGAGAKYVSFFFNRMKDRDIDPIAQIEKFLQYSDGNSQVICGSIRHVSDILQACEYPRVIPTVPRKVLEKMLAHEGSVSSIQDFQRDIDAWAQESNRQEQ